MLSISRRPLDGARARHASRSTGHAATTGLHPVRPGLAAPPVRPMHEVYQYLYRQDMSIPVTNKHDYYASSSDLWNARHVTSLRVAMRVAMRVAGTGQLTRREHAVSVGVQ